MTIFHSLVKCSLSSVVTATSINCFSSLFMKGLPESSSIVQRVHALMKVGTIEPQCTSQTIYSFSIFNSCLDVTTTFPANTCFHQLAELNYKNHSMPQFLLANRYLKHILLRYYLRELSGKYWTEPSLVPQKLSFSELFSTTAAEPSI